MESLLVNEDIIQDENYYNIALGGKGGAIVLVQGHPNYEETCKKISETKLATSDKISNYVKELHKQKRVGMYGKKQSDHQKKMVSEKLRGREKTKEHIENHKLSLKKVFADPNYVHPNKGRPKPKKTCCYCEKEIDRGNYVRYHGDKCKLKETDGNRRSI